MELFSVPCITCRAKIKVRHASAVGQILACPRCGGMVQIVAPDGWKAPAEAPPPKREPAPKKAPTEKPEVGDAAIPPTYIAEPVADEIGMPTLVTPQEQRLRRRILLVGGVAAALVIAFGIWSTLGDTADDEVPLAGPVPTASTSATPRKVASATPSATAVVKSTAVLKPSTTPSSSAVASATASRPSILALAGTPSATAAGMAAAPSGTSRPTAMPPMPAATAVAMPPVPNPPLAARPTPSATGNAPSVLVDGSAKLQQPAAGLRLTQASRRDALEIVAQLAGLALDVDWDTLTPNEVGLKEKVDAATADGTLRDLLEQLLASKKLRWTARGNVLTIHGNVPSTEAMQAEYAVGDLTTGDAAQAAALAHMAQSLVEPETWTRAGGVGTVQAAANSLTVAQSPRVQQEVAALLDRLRLARGKTPQSSQATSATLFGLARTKLDMPISMNFRPAVPLAIVLARLEASADVTLTIDAAALAEQGASGTTPVGIAADKHPLAQVLTALCEPRGWAWRIIDGATFEITTQDTLRSRAYLEVYDLRPLLTDGARPEPLLARLKAQTESAGWLETGGVGVLVFDAASGSAFVRQHQAGHQRIEQFLAEAIAASAPPAARPTASATAPKPTSTPPKSPQP